MQHIVVYIIVILTLTGVVANRSSDVTYTAIINSDGTLGAWSSWTTLPIKMYGVTTIVTKNKVYFLGGANTTDAIYSSLYYCNINSDGTLSTIVAGTSIPRTCYVASVFITNNRLYIVGGWTGTTSTNSIIYTNFSGGKNDYSEYYSNMSNEELNSVLLEEKHYCLNYYYTFILGLHLKKNVIEQFYSNNKQCNN
jgi:hypothetical protein